MTFKIDKIKQDKKWNGKWVTSLKCYFQQYLDSDGQFYSYLSHVIDKFYHPKLYQVHLSRDRNQTHNLSGDRLISTVNVNITTMTIRI
jgi:hypothetical protein